MAQEAKGASPDTIVETAPAKINLALHVTDQRSDGYHLLDSIVTFAEEGDRLSFARGNEDSFSADGRFAAALGAADADLGSNLVVKARDRLRRYLESGGIAAPPVSIKLRKNLPIASGIGGGSADAAATLRGLQRFWKTELNGQDLSMIALALGADVPMCLACQPLRAIGIGEALAPLDGMPAFAMVLANPLMAVSTPQVFSRLASKSNPPVKDVPKTGDARAWIEWLATLRNDLEEPARMLLPEIETLSAMLTDSGARLVRMSGSGATCFGLYDDMTAARQAADRLAMAMPDWYFVPTKTVTCSRRP